MSEAQNRLVDEFIVHVTHTLQMDWFLPGIAPTGRPLVVPHVAVIAFEGGRLASEHIYWDQGTVLRQLDLVPTDVPVFGTESADRLRE